MQFRVKAANRIPSITTELHAEARRHARRRADGEYIPLAEQDPDLWNWPMIVEAEELLSRAGTLGSIGRYQLEGALQSAHVYRCRTGEDNWAARADLLARCVANTEAHDAYEWRSTWSTIPRFAAFAAASGRFTRLARGDLYFNRATIKMSAALLFCRRMIRYMDSRSIETLCRRVVALGLRVEPLTLVNATWQRSWMNKHGIFVLPEPSILEFQELLRWFAKQWGDQFATTTLSKHLTNILSLVVSQGAPAAEAALRSVISELDAFKGETTTYIPLEGIVLEDRESWRLGKVVLHRYSDAFLTKAVNCDWLTPEYVRRESRANVWAEIHITAEPERAVSRADEIMEGVVDVLRFWMALYVPRGGAVSVGLEGEVATGNRLRIAVDAKGAHTSPTTSHAKLPLMISARMIEQLDQAGVLLLADLVGTTSGFIGLVLSALRLYGLAKIAPGLAERLLWLMMTLECFLSVSDSPVVQSIAEGVPLFFAIGVDQRVAMKKELQRLYKFRSKVAHGESMDITGTDVASLDGIVQSFLLAMIERRKQFSGKKDLLAFLERERLSD